MAEKKLFKNYGKLDQILTGMDPVRFMPGEVKEIDPDILKRYAPEDVKNIREYKAEPKPAPVQPGAPAPTEEEQASADLVALLRDANNVGPQ